MTFWWNLNIKMECFHSGPLWWKILKLNKSLKKYIILEDNLCIKETQFEWNFVWRSNWHVIAWQSGAALSLVKSPVILKWLFIFCVLCFIYIGTSTFVLFACSSVERFFNYYNCSLAVVGISLFSLLLCTFALYLSF